MPTRTKNAEMSKIVSNSEIHLDHCLCESRGFKIGKSHHRRCSVKTVFLNILQNRQKKTCVRVCNSFLKNKVKITRSNLSKRDVYTETLTQVFSVNFEKSYEYDYSASLPLTQCQIKSLLFRVQLCLLSLTSFLCYTKIIMTTREEHDKVVN